jgi:hypothetical protein
METNPKKQRPHFDRNYASGPWSMSELCGRYQITRHTGYESVCGCFPSHQGGPSSPQQVEHPKEH